MTNKTPQKPPFDPDSLLFKVFKIGATILLAMALIRFLAAQFKAELKEFAEFFVAHVEQSAPSEQSKAIVPVSVSSTNTVTTNAVAPSSANLAAVDSADSK